MRKRPSQAEPLPKITVHGARGASAKKLLTQVTDPAVRRWLGALLRKGARA